MADDDAPDIEEFRRAPNPRIVRPDGPDRRNFVVKGVRHGAIRDVYHTLLTMPWWAFVALTGSIYLAVNVLFALLYWPDTAGLAGGHAGSFADAFNFSVETLGTIGYGALAPKDAYVNGLVTAEAFTSIFLTATLTGLIFSRVSRPTARVLFTKIAVMADFDGRPMLMCRAANVRANRMLEAEATMTLAWRRITREGIALREFTQMGLRHARSPLFAISWTIMHPIDEKSPIHGLDDAALREMGAEFVVTVAGVDETSSQRVHARHSYVPDEIVWGRHFADVVIPPRDGTDQWTIDYRKFHDLRPEEPAQAPRPEGPE